MKFRSYFICLLVLPLFASCSDWFDVEPKSQVKEEELFKNQKGFMDALYGIYTTMTERGAYGGAETISVLDILAGTYSQVGSAYTNIFNYNFEATTGKEKLDSIWLVNYNCVANCNYILKNIDSRRDIFDEGVYEIIKGEALALRAFLHFDVLRGFGPVPTASNLDKPAIPYVDRVTHVPVAQSTVREVVDLCLKDLAEARELMAPYDPLGPAFPNYREEEQSTTTPEETYTNGGAFMYRQSRMNYYGVVALMARVAMWGGDSYRTAALGYAREVIESAKFPLIEEDDATSSPYIYMANNEYISGLYVRNIITTQHNVFFRNSYRDNNSNLQTTSTYLFISQNRRGEIFGAGAAYDWRNMYMFVTNEYEQGVEYVGKYSTFNIRRIPLIKVSEMYLIAAECSGDFSYLNTLRAHRGYYSDPLDPGTSDLQEEIAKEYRKEFIAEGQLLYYYKRTNARQIPNATAPVDYIYAFPFPDDEIEFGDIKN